MNFKRKLFDLMYASMVFLLRKYPHNWFTRSFPMGKYYLLDIARHEKKVNDYNILDVGANVGQSVKMFHEWFIHPKIFSFEPVGYTFNLLKKNCEEYKNVYCLNYALGNENSEIEIVLSHQNQNNSLKETVFSKNSGPKEIIKVRRLDDIYEEFNISKIDILKIDTEGFEMEVLNGAIKLLKKGFIKYIYCEVGFNEEPAKTSFSEINGFLRKYNYQLAGFYETNRYGPNNLLIKFSNALFVLN